MVFNLTFTGIFVLELIIRLIVYGLNFFRKFWNNFDFLIISLSCSSFIIQYSSIELGSNSSLISLLNVVELLRILRVIKKIPYLRKLFIVLKVVLPQVANIAILLFTVILIYSVLGVDLFAFIKPQSNAANSNVHFRSPFVAMMNLVRCMTGESWFLQMADCARELQPNFVCFSVTSYEDYQIYGIFFIHYKYISFI